MDDIGDNLKFIGCQLKREEILIAFSLLLKHFILNNGPHIFKDKRVSICRELRSSDSIRLQVSLEKGTFQDIAALLFNNLLKILKRAMILVCLRRTYLNL